MRAKMLVPLLLALSPALAAAQEVCIADTAPGRAQSPVNIVGDVPYGLSPIGTSYPELRVSATNTGKTVRVDVPPGDTITVYGERFGLYEIHFHWPGEHELAGDTFPVEIHMVHRSAAGHLAVLGSWVSYGGHNRAWEPLWNQLPRPGQPPVSFTLNVPAMFAFRDLNAETVYRYCGSLTTGTEEPYAEGVTWLMRRLPVRMTQDQVKQLRAVMLLPYTRGVQELFGRPIRYRPAN